MTEELSFDLWQRNRRFSALEPTQPYIQLVLGERGPDQKGVYYTGIKVFNNLPPNIRNLSCDAKRFNSELGKYLHLKSFYTIEEYYNSCKL